VNIAVLNLKGGTGKTTSSVFLAAGFTRAGARTLLVDADPQGSALAWSGLVEDWPIPTLALPQPVLHRQLPQLGRDYEHVVVDCPPAHEAIVRSALLVADLVVMPMAPSMMDLDRLRPTLTLLADVAPQNEPTFWALLTRVRSGTTLSSAAREWLTANEVPVLEAEIPLREVFARALGEVPPAGTAYDAVLAELSRCASAQTLRRAVEQTRRRAVAQARS
jgi:chromosome partitioning protein